MGTGWLAWCAVVCLRRCHVAVLGGARSTGSAECCVNATPCPLTPHLFPQGLPHDQSSDIFSLAITFIELVTGRCVFGCCCCRCSERVEAIEAATSLVAGAPAVCPGVYQPHAL